MLAYVFWHWPANNADHAAYENLHPGFQRSIAEARPAGFDRSLVFKLPGAPWIVASSAIYEDRYLVEDFADLGTLNAGAISGANRSPHDAVAQRADGGCGALYRLRRGCADIAKAAMSAWFSKPRGLPYADFYDGVPVDALANGGGLWERQMVLGPSPECCLMLAERTTVPNVLNMQTLRLKLIWGDA